MLNYVWAGLIVAALVFALVTDIGELRNDAYGNDKPLAATIVGNWPTREGPVDVVIAPDAYASHFHVSEKLPEKLPATLTALDKGYLLKFADGAALPTRLATMRDFTDDKVLEAHVDAPAQVVAGLSSYPLQLQFSAIRFVKLRAITQAALDMSKNAVLTITFGLIGVLALWLGLMKIAESAGLIEIAVRIIQPVLHPLFPEIPKGHPAMGYIAVNLAGNILGLGNATTAMGIKAMEELQTLNPSEDTATNAMVMLLAIHTAAFQFVPPATLIALMGFSAMELFIPMLLVGVIATGIGILAAKLLGMLPMYRRTDPMLAPSPVVLEGRGAG